MFAPNSLTSRLIGDRSFYKEVAALAIPVILQQLISTTMGFVDGIMVGQIDAQSLVSVSVANKYFTILQMVLYGITGGLGIYISQYFGARDHDKGQGLFAMKILGSIAAASVFFALISIFPKAVISAFVSDANTIQYGKEYLYYVRFSYVPFAISLACMTALRSIGQTKIPLFVSSFAIALNTGLNFLLIFGNWGFPAMGVGGAGLATLLSRLVEMALYLGLLAFSCQYFSLRLAPAFSLGKVIFRQVVRKTVPLIGNELLWSLGSTLLFWTYCQLGETAIAGFAIVEMTSNVIYVIFAGMGAAVSVLVGARLGASLFAEARKNAGLLLSLGAFVAILIGFVIFMLSRQIPLLFNVAQISRQLASEMLRILAVIFAVITVNVTFFFILRVGGDMRSTILMDSAFTWICIIPLALLLGLWVKPAMPVFYLVIQATELIKIVVAFRLYRQKRWICSLT